MTIAILGIGLVFALFLLIAEVERRKRRRRMGLRAATPPLHETRRPKSDWRNDAPAWSDPRYFSSSRRRLPIDHLQNANDKETP